MTTIAAHRCTGCDHECVGETPLERKRRLTRERVRRYRERRRSSTATLHSVTPQTPRAIHSVTRVTPPASRSTPTTSTDAPGSTTGNALLRYPPHPQALTPPSGGVSEPPRDADSVTPIDLAECRRDVGTKPAQVRWARAAAGLRARARDWSDDRCSAAVRAAADQHGADPDDCWRALVWLAGQPGTRAPGLLKSALPRALAAIERSSSRTKSAPRTRRGPGTAATTRSSRATGPAPAPTAERSDPWTTRTAARTAAATSTARPTAVAAPATDRPLQDDPFQLVLPLDLLSGYQQARAVCTKLFGRPPDPTRATPAYRPARRRTSAA